MVKRMLRVIKYKVLIVKCEVVRMFIKIYHSILSRTPWRKAYLLLSLSKYIDSSVFRERCELLGVEYAIDQYLDHDYWYWHRKITRKEMIGIVVKPYTYIDNLRPNLLYMKHIL
jgi:hypothetical protein